MKKTAVCFLAVLICNSAIAAVHYVPDEYATIQAAVNACQDFDIVIIAPGRYYGSGNRNINFNGKSITVRSTDPSNPQFVNTTVIDCEDKGRAFAFYMGENADSTVAGLTVTNGYALLGGAIYCYNNSSPSITNCVFSTNSAVLGGAIACTNSNSRSKITNCKVTANSALVGGGGIYCNGASPIIRNCIISGNFAPNGGAMYSHNVGNPVVANSTISGNAASSSAGGVYCYKSSNLTINNSILWANTAMSASEVFVGNLGAATSIRILYSDIQGSDENVLCDSGCTVNWGQGNINIYPNFVEMGNISESKIYMEGDYHLLEESPCIDAGDPAFVAAPDETDIDGDPRIIGGRVDMGAYELMVSCFGVNHVKLKTKAGKKDNKVELKGTFSPDLPINFARDDVIYIIDDGQGHMLSFVIPAGSFEPEGKPEKQKFKFDSPKHSQPDIKAKFDFLKCKFELKVKGIMDTSGISGDSLAIVLQAGENPANLVEEVVQVEAEPKHLEYKREPKLNCCPKCKGIALLEVTSD